LGGSGRSVFAGNFLLADYSNARAAGLRIGTAAWRGFSQLFVQRSAKNRSNDLLLSSLFAGLGLLTNKLFLIFPLAGLVISLVWLLSGKETGKIGLSGLTSCRLCWLGLL
jgi:hypothetical protein